MLKKTSLCATLLLTAACAADEPAEEPALDAPAAAPAVDPVQSTQRATAELRNAEGQLVGTATLEEGESGVRIALEAANLPEGTHAFHVHETGECTPPDFTSAGGHFNPTGAQHGLENPQGPHAGDMENFDVGADGTAQIAVDNDRVTLAAGQNSLLDADGSALVVHAGADDYVTDPSGDAGDRIACGVITSG